MKKFSAQYIRMIDLSLNVLKVIAKHKNMKDYENKSENYLMIQK